MAGFWTTGRKAAPPGGFCLWRKGALILALLAGSWVAAWAGATYEQAMTLYHAKRFAEAREAFREFALGNSASAQAKAAQFYSIKCLFEDKAYGEFDREVETLRATEPGHPALDDLTFLQAYALELQGRGEAATAKFESFRAAYPNSTYVSKLGEHIAACRALSEPPLPEASAEATSATLTRRREYAAWLGSLCDGRRYDQCLDRSAQFLTACPSYAAPEEILFYEMKSLRGLKRWEEARAKANDIAQRYPNSEYGRQMGGSGGRSEDQAAIDFAAVMTDYHGKKFDDCAAKIEAFFDAYPRNWRVTEAWRVYCYALYHSGNAGKFTDASDAFLNSYREATCADEVMYLRIALEIRQGRGAEARKRIEFFRSEFPTSSRLGHVQQAELESYVKYTNIDGLDANLAQKAFPLLDRCLNDFAVSHPDWYEHDLGLGAKLFKKSADVKAWREYLVQQKSQWETERPDLFPGIAKEIVGSLAEEKQNDAVLEQGKLLLPAIADGNPNKNAIIRAMSDAYLNLGQYKEAKDILMTRVPSGTK